MISYYCTRTGNEQGMRMLPPIAMNTRYCRECDISFIPKKNNPDQKFCTESCQKSYNGKKRRKRHCDEQVKT